MGCEIGRWASKAELARWAEETLGLVVPGVSVCPHHQSPLDYLWEACCGEGRDLVVWAPRGGGKTRLAAAATLVDLASKPGCQVRILGGSLEQSLRLWEHLVPDIARVVDQSKIVEEKARKIVLENGSAAGVLTQSQKAVRGLHVQKLRCDEVDEFDPAVWAAAQLSIKSKGGVKGTVEAISTLHNAGGVMSRVVEEAGERGKKLIKWCVLDVLEKCPPDRVCEACLLNEECAGKARKREIGGHLTVEDAIALKRRVSQERWQAEMLCLRAKLDGAVFPHFDEAVHVKPDVRLDASELWVGVDFGFSNPFVALFIRQDRTGKVVVEEEYVASETMMHVHVAQIKRRTRGARPTIACDPAGNGRNDQTARSNVDVLRAQGWRVLTRASRIADGLELIRQALAPGAGEPTLFISPSCKHLIAAMKGYRYSPGTEIPVKDGHDHLVDALRYFYVNRKGSKAEASSY